jgi:hypothetical protein
MVASVALVAMNAATSEARTSAASPAAVAPSPSGQSSAVALVAAANAQPLPTVASNLAALAAPATPAPVPSNPPDPTPMVSAALPAAPGPATWSLDLYDPRAERWQDPDLTACTAAAAQSMLNTISYSGTDPTLTWQPTNSYSMQESILSFERAHMTMLKRSAGSDPHGWRNALNYYGWGSISAGVYRDLAYSSIDAAQKAAVIAIARFHKPVGVFSQGGAHAEFVTGYRVIGDDPRTGSSEFRILGVYLTDPWRVARYRDAYVTSSRWRWGFTWLRFEPYLQPDSPYRDPIDGQIGKVEWYGKWVIVKPVK